MRYFPAARQRAVVVRILRNAGVMMRLYIWGIYSAEYLRGIYEGINAVRRVA